MSADKLGLEINEARFNYRSCNEHPFLMKSSGSPMPSENISKLTELTGEWKTAQKLMFVFVQFTYIMVAWECFHLVFLVPEVEYHCLSDTNSTLKVDPCSAECPEVIFDHQRFKETLTEKLSLICGRSWLKSFSTTLVMLGGMFSNLLAGYLADRIGRRKVILLALLPYVIGILFGLFPQNYVMFATSATLIGLGFIIMANFCFVLLFEFCGEAQRSTAGVSMEIGFTLGGVLLGGVAWALRDWFQIQLVNAGLICLLTLSWFLPESFEWLVKQGRTEEAIETVKKIMRVNGEPKMADTEIRILVDKLAVGIRTGSESRSFTFLFRSPDLRCKTLSLCYVWFSAGFVFFGFSLNMDVFSNDMFLSFVLSSVSSLPSVIFVLFLLRFIHIKHILVACNVLAALVSYFYIVGQVLPWYKTLSVVLGWVFSAPAVMMLYNVTSELFPTEVRCKGVGLGSFMGRLGTALSPFVKELELATSDYVPMIIFGTMCITSAVLIFRLNFIEKRENLEENTTDSRL